MDLKDVQRKPEERKIVRVNLKTTPKDSKWMKENNVSPQLLFDKALEELMKEEKSGENKLIRTSKTLGRMGDALNEGLVGRRKK